VSDSRERNTHCSPGDWGRAIILAVFVAAVISSMDNFLRPKLAGNRVKFSELVMFFSVLGGLQAFRVHRNADSNWPEYDQDGSRCECDRP